MEHKITLHMAKRRRLTGFARFLLVMVILVPLAYFGASYLNGEDPIENFKRILNGEMPSITLEDEPQARPEPLPPAPTGRGQEQPAAEQQPSGAVSTGRTELETRIRALEENQRKLEQQLSEQEKRMRWMEGQLKELGNN